jgi:hypothetical protein
MKHLSDHLGVAAASVMKSTRDAMGDRIGARVRTELAAPQDPVSVADNTLWGRGRKGITPQESFL